LLPIPHMGFWETIQSEFSDIPSVEMATRLTLRLLMAGLFGGILGYERESKGKSAGLRTHVLLSMGTAFFVMVPAFSGMDNESLSRVLQGILTGIGFIGAGTILKRTDQKKVEGLTTSAGLWFTAAIGVASGMGRELSALIGCIVGFAILNLVPHVAKFPHARGESGLLTNDIATNRVAP